MLICKYFLDCRESSAFSQEYHVWRRLVRWPDVFFLALRAYDGSWHYSPILFRVSFVRVRARSRWYKAQQRNHNNDITSSLVIYFALKDVTGASARTIVSVAICASISCALIEFFLKLWHEKERMNSLAPHWCLPIFFSNFVQWVCRYFFNLVPNHLILRLLTYQPVFITEKCFMYCIIVESTFISSFF